MPLACAERSSVSNAPPPATSPPAPVPAPAPDKPAQAQADEHVIHNVHRVTEKIISGGVPEGDAAFDELAAMGVKTIISVDGATPDVDRAKARGMRYVHIPIGYDGLSPDEQIHLARAARDLPGPIFVHCHHGKHRSPAAAASIAVLLGAMSPQEGEAFMKMAGTAPNYAGLYACVLSAQAVDAATLDAQPPDYPEVAQVGDFVDAMVETDTVFDQLVLIQKAGWKAPKNHPDLVPAAEAGRLVDLLRTATQHEDRTKRPEEFRTQMTAAVALSQSLEDGIVGNLPAADLDMRIQAVQQSCKTCHAAYRDKRW